VLPLVGCSMSESASGEATGSSTASDNSSSVECQGCGKELGSTTALSYHYKSSNIECEGHECPTCGKSYFTSEMGVKLHHSRVHGESLRLVTVECDYCGKEDKKEPHHVENTERQYCNKDCQANHLREEVESECRGCGEVNTYSPPSEARDFCSDPCRFEYFSGETHPQHKPNGGHRYGPNWKQQSEKARKRDNYRCQSCGKHEKDERIKLHVHHIVPRSEFTTESGEYNYKEGNVLSNLVSFCSSCHPSWEGIPLKPVLI